MLPRDPYILLSYVNTKLRNEYSSLDAMCDDLDESRETLVETLGGLGYDYDLAENRFKER